MAAIPPRHLFPLIVEPFPGLVRYTFRGKLMMNCLHFRSLWGAQQAKLNPGDSSLMRRHLTVCHRCQAYDQQMRAPESGAKNLSIPDMGRKALINKAGYWNESLS
jgi:hypothetical protein